MPVTRHPLAIADKRLSDVPVDQAAIARLEQSLRQMAGPECDLPGEFYKRLFARHPALRALFPPDMTAQKKKLLNALVTTIENLRAPATVRTRLEELGASHVRYGAKREHYPIVCACIVDAMAAVSGKSWNEDLALEWRTAMEMVSEIMLSGARQAN